MRAVRPSLSCANVHKTTPHPLLLRRDRFRLLRAAYLIQKTAAKASTAPAATGISGFLTVLCANFPFFRKNNASRIRFSHISAAFPFKTGIDAKAVNSSGIAFKIPAYSKESPNIFPEKEFRLGFIPEKFYRAFRSGG